MKPTQLTELFANIKKTFVSFFSILMFVALGVGIFLGIIWVAPGLQTAADKVFEEGSFHDFQIQFPYGLTDDDIRQLAEVEGVSDIEAGYQSFQTTIAGNKKAVVKLQSMNDRIDTLSVVEGELPKEPDEIALSAEAAKVLGIEVGSSIMFEHDATENDTMSALGNLSELDLSDSSDMSTQAEPAADNDGMKYLNGSTYKVVALVHSPEYIATSNATYGYSTSVSGAVDAVGWVVPKAFDPSAFQNAYPIVSVRCDTLRGMNSFAGDYRSKDDAIEKRVSELGTKLADLRYDNLHDQAQKKIDEAQAKLDEANRQIAEGEKKLADGRAELKSKLAKANAELADAYDQLVYWQNEYDAKLAQYNQFRGAYDAIVSEIEGTRAEVDALAAEARQADADYRDGKITKEEYDRRCEDLAARANAVLAPARQFIADLPVVDKSNVVELLILAASLLDNYRDIAFPINGETMTLNEAGARLDAAKAELDSASSRLRNGWAAYYAGIDERDALVAEAEQTIADGEKKIEDAKKQVAENEPKLEAAKEQLAAMKDYAWTVLGRAGNISAGEVEVFSDVTTNLSFSMALLFVIVGLLVTYSAVSRLVHEQITQIGTKKALGLRKHEITMSFLLYAGIAVVAGAVIGTIVGVIAVEGIIANALKDMFIFGAFPSHFGLELFILVTLLELGLVLAATYLACRGILKKHAVDLLRGEEPPKAKTRFYERWALWGRLPLFTQTVVNNCVNDKRRVFSTIVGVAGCTALIVTAITLNNDVLKSYDRHYENVYDFNTIIYADPAVAGSAAGVERVFTDAGSDAAQVLHKSFIMVDPGGSSAAIQVIVPADEASFEKIYHVKPVEGAELDLSSDGVWVSQAYRDHFGAKVGDTLTLDSRDGTVHKVPILGFCEFWLTYHELVMGRDYYEREFGTELAPNAVLGDMQFENGAPAADFSKVEGFDSAVDDKAYQHINFETFATVSSAVVLIYLALSALMAVVVLLNLNVMFIDEKKRELIVLMINGYSVKDAKKYIYNDTIVLTAIGIILGIVLGCIMGSITVVSMEPSTAVFVKSVDWMAVLIGVVGSAVLAVIMCVIALRRISHFELTDINRF